MTPFSNLDRRQFLGNVSTGLMGIGLANLMARESAAFTQGTHFPPKAKRVLQIFCPGAASHMDIRRLSRRDASTNPKQSSAQSHWPVVPDGADRQHLRGGDQICR